MSLENFHKQADSIVAQIDWASEQAVREAKRLLDDLRRKVIRELARDDLEHNLSAMKDVQRRIDVEVAQMQGTLTQMLREQLLASFKRGVFLITQPIQNLPEDIAIRRISEETLAVSQSFSADLITGISNDIRTRVNGILQRMVLGGIDKRQAMIEVGQSLDSRGAFRSVAARAEAIVRTETLRIAAQSAHEQMVAQAEVMAKAGYETLKSWSATLDHRTRLTHIIADAEYGSKDTAIELDAFFVVGGEPALYPRDPALSAAEAVNCRCAVVPVIKKKAQTEQKAA